MVSVASGGGIAAGIFCGKPLVAQIIGSVAIPIWAFVTCFILFAILKSINVWRVSPEEEMEGLDRSEHGVSAYESVPALGAAD